MSRIANAPVTLPGGVEVTLQGQAVTVKGPRGTLSHNVHRDVSVVREQGELRFAPRSGSKPAIAPCRPARWPARRGRC